MKYLLPVLFCLSFFSTVNAQVNSNQLPAIKLANIDSLRGSYMQVLSYPRLVAATVDCDITEFTILFTVKDGASYGPFTNHNSLLTDEQKIIIKNLRNDKVKITISNITMRCNGQFTQPHNFNFYMGY